MLSLKDAIVTVDALHCQRAIAQQIVDQGGDYALALKGNQATLHADVSLYLDDPARKAGDFDTTVDADNGRIETRTATITSNIDCSSIIINGRDWFASARGRRRPKPRSKPRIIIIRSAPRSPPSASTRWSVRIGGSKTASIGASTSS
jgi:hypothetical protein